MRNFIFLLLILFTSCNRPLYIKDRHFKSAEKEYKMDTDLKVLVYKSLERAFVTEKDIADYKLMWKKHRIYVSNEYQAEKDDFKSQEDWDETVSYLKPNEVPNAIGEVKFSLKSKEALQKISDRTWEDFLHASFSLIKIEGNIATIKINNSWIVSKHTKDMAYLSGGGYTCTYKKIDDVWEFQRKTSSWIS
ncbi:hypothetical protein SAMN05661096_03439 [Marivirga sericea]|uniref:Uncharacterized protein n=1 Tax=Marivirga sericea TaxID=1028 RepID=A0A1X7L377_9BACT|nr:hypothetical protein [Marivirga sericea]SMG48200.1 hypothetical protein SAMN05661096_03439 [Marivirga sericea]